MGKLPSSFPPETIFERQPIVRWEIALLIPGFMLLGAWLVSRRLQRTPMKRNYRFLLLASYAAAVAGILGGLLYSDFEGRLWWRSAALNFVFCIGLLAAALLAIILALVFLISALVVKLRSRAS